MLIFKFELTPDSIENGINGFSLGDITIQDKKNIVTTKEKVPSQSMMIFSSIVSLLDGLRQFFQDSYAKNYTSVSIGSSFKFAIKRNKNQMLILTTEGKIFEEVTQAELLKAVWNGVNNFMKTYGKYVDVTHSIYEDLHESIEDFQELFELW